MQCSETLNRPRKRAGTVQTQVLYTPMHQFFSQYSPMKMSLSYFPHQGLCFPASWHFPNSPSKRNDLLLPVFSPLKFLRLSLNAALFVKLSLFIKVNLNSFNTPYIIYTCSPTFPPASCHTSLYYSFLTLVFSFSESCFNVHYNSMYSR